MLETDLRSRKSCELLAPAGNFEKLKTAFMYGADAAYLGGTSFGLRAAAGNFTDEEIKEAIDLANGEGKKIYVTLNILPRTSELDELARYAEKLVKMGVHGAIISDIGAFMTVRKAAPDLPIHVSTQANNLNAATVRFWLENGAERVNLARELTVREIKEIDRDLKDIPHELEAFVHGAMCMSYSGRCMLSDYLAGRSSNRGDCAQPCRWKYFLSEEKRPGEYMPVEESKEGTFIFNSKDLCMIEHIPELIDAGITSLKIEGRMKSEFYIAVTVRAYRIALDEYFRDPEGYSKNKELLKELTGELESVSHREYSTGFYFGDRGSQIYGSSSYLRSCDFMGTVRSCEKSDDGSYDCVIIQRGNFKAGDVLEFVPPKGKMLSWQAAGMKNSEEEDIEAAPHAMMEVYVKLPEHMPEGTIVRRRKTR